MYKRQTKIINLNLEENKRIIAISDIHGYATYLDGVLKKAHYSKEDILIIVGDIIEKGKESLETIRYIMRLRKENANVYATMGNVDYGRVRSFMDNSEEGNSQFLHSLQWTKSVWKRGLFLDILKELGIALDEICEENIADVKEKIWKNYQEELEFLWNLPTILTIGDYIFVHAGIPTDSLEKLQDTEAFTYLKVDEFMNTDVKFEKNVVVGHWPVCLYRKEIDCMNPLFDYERHIIGIDGGCALKNGAQLNALIIPNARADIHEVSYVAYDDYPVVTALKPQKAKEKTIFIRFFDSEVELLEESDREEKGGMVSLRHISTGRRFTAPASYLYKRKGKLFCDDYCDAHLEVMEGDLLSVVEETSEGLLVKKDGIIGWYKGNTK